MPRRHGRGLGGHFHAFPGSCGVVLAVQYGAISIGTWSVRTHCIQPTIIHTEISKRSDWLMSTDPVPILMAPYCICGGTARTGHGQLKNPLQPAGKQPGGCKNSPAELLTG